MNIDVGTVPVHTLDAPAANLGGDGHGRVVRVEFLYHGSDIVHRLPDGRVVTRVETFHLVADTPQQNRRVVPVAQHGLAGSLQLLTHLVLIAVVEAVALVTEPDADGHRQTERVRRIEARANVIRAPGTQRVGTRRRELFQRCVPAGTADEVRLATAQQLPALFRLTQFHRDGPGSSCRGP